MPLLDRLRPEQHAELRRLRKKIANRVFGVELPNRGRDVRAPRLGVRQDPAWLRTGKPLLQATSHVGGEPASTRTFFRSSVATRPSLPAGFRSERRRRWNTRKARASADRRHAVAASAENPVRARPERFADLLPTVRSAGRTARIGRSSSCHRWRGSRSGSRREP